MAHYKMDEESEAWMTNNLNDVLTTDTADPTVSVDIPIFFYNDSIFLLLAKTTGSLQTSAKCPEKIDDDDDDDWHYFFDWTRMTL